MESMGGCDHRRRVMASDLARCYGTYKDRISARLEEFSRLWEAGSEDEVFAELCFCLLTPQSSARACDAAVKDMADTRLLLTADEGDIATVLAGKARFHNNKARYIVRARVAFTRPTGLAVRRTLRPFDDPPAARRWLVENVLGLGYKEASHFLRNVGRGGDLAILDRHILRNLAAYRVIESVPRSLTPRRYSEIEREMRRFARDVGIPMDELDLLLWAKETGEVFK